MDQQPQPPAAFADFPSVEMANDDVLDHGGMLEDLPDFRLDDVLDVSWGVVDEHLLFADLVRESRVSTYFCCIYLPCSMSSVRMASKESS